MIVVHLIYDLTELYNLFPAPRLYLPLKNSGGTVFFLISGICAVLGHRHLRRGLIVLGCGLLVSIITAAAGMPVRFGVLHCMGICMLLYPMLRKLPSAALLSLFVLFAVLGTLFQQITVTFPFLYPLGLTAENFDSADYFPLFPYLGYFLFGVCLGRRLYPHRLSLFPQFPFNSPFSRFLRFCGRHTLPLYLIHQPVLMFLIETVILTGGIFHEN